MVGCSERGSRGQEQVARGVRHQCEASRRLNADASPPGRRDARIREAELADQQLSRHIGRERRVEAGRGGPRKPLKYRDQCAAAAVADRVGRHPVTTRRVEVVTDGRVRGLQRAHPSRYHADGSGHGVRQIARAFRADRELVIAQRQCRESDARLLERPRFDRLVESERWCFDGEGHRVGRIELVAVRRQVQDRLLARQVFRGDDGVDEERQADRDLDQGGSGVEGVAEGRRRHDPAGEIVWRIERGSAASVGSSLDELEGRVVLELGADLIPAARSGSAAAAEVRRRHQVGRI